MIKVASSLDEIPKFASMWNISKQMMIWGAAASAVLSVLPILLRGQYVKLFPEKKTVRDMTQGILLAYAIVAPVKVQNMILGGGIIRSGGKPSIPWQWT